MEFDYTCTGPRITVHRQPTKGEIARGYGATHYKDMPLSMFECFIVGGKKRFTNAREANDYANALYKKSGVICGIERHVKAWTVCPIDGLRYYC